jgi:hypothetical protein
LSEQKIWLLFSKEDGLFILHPELGPCQLYGPFGSLIGSDIDFKSHFVSDEAHELELAGETLAEVVDDLTSKGFSKKKIRNLNLRKENVAQLNRR